MIWLLMQALSQAILATVALDLVTDLGSGALNGLLAGAAVGAVVWAVSKAPDTMGRVLLFTVVLSLITLFVVLFQVLSALPEVSMGAIIASFQDRSSELGAIIVQGGSWLAAAAIGGAVLAVLFSVPGEALKGALIGLALGAVLGAGLTFAMLELQIGLSGLVFQLVVGLLTWGVLASIGGR